MKEFDVLSSIRESINILGEPYFHITSVYADKILSEAQKKHRVFFTGAGGDECYYGYDNLLFLAMDFYFRISPYIPSFAIRFLDKITKKKYSSVLFSTKETFKENYYKRNYSRISHLFEDDTNINSWISKTLDSFLSFVKSKKLHRY
jgi:asparagine synthetase B (glutamine-hydrolysing)